MAVFFRLSGVGTVGRKKPGVRGALQFFVVGVWGGRAVQGFFVFALVILVGFFF